LTTDIKVGDEVIARSKTDPLTVVHGVVIYAVGRCIEIEPTGHEGDGLVLYLEYWDIEHVTPEIQFGPGACVQSGTNLATRAQDGSWFWMKIGSHFGGGSGFKDAFWREAVLSGKAEVLFYGVGVTPHESWPKVVSNG
jgi:hypothetical protein